MRAVRPLVGLVVVVAIAAGAAVALRWALERRHVASDTAADIERQLGELDPVTRAAVVAKLGAGLRRRKG